MTTEGGEVWLGSRLEARRDDWREKSRCNLLYRRLLSSLGRRGNNQWWAFFLTVFKTFFGEFLLTGGDCSELFPFYFLSFSFDMRSLFVYFLSLQTFCNFHASFFLFALIKINFFCFISLRNHFRLFFIHLNPIHVFLFIFLLLISNKNIHFVWLFVFLFVFTLSFLFNYFPYFLEVPVV